MSINRASSDNKQEDYSQYFDDDFEVIYEGDLPDLSVDEPEDDDYYDVLSNLSELDHTKKIDYVKENADTAMLRKQKERQGKKRRMPNLFSPAGKTVKAGAKTLKAGTKAALRILNLILRCAALILSAIILWMLAQNFWENYRPLGDIASAATEQNYALAAYGGIALFLLLIEGITCLSLLFSRYGSGLFSFLFIYIGSFLSDLMYPLIPASPEPLQGVQAALLVYGNLKNSLLPLCAAGVIICLIRRLLNRRH